MTEEKTLVPLERYLKTGSHIGTKFKTGDMQRYIYKKRKDELRVLDVATIDEIIGIAAKFMANYENEKIVVVSRKLYGQEPVKQFALATGARALTRRFVPGTLTNPHAKEFIEPTLVIITDPESDKQAIDEALRIRVPVIALCTTSNYLKNIDLIIPINNKGRKSLALVYWLLAKELLKAKGIINKDSDFKKTVEDFEYKLEEAGEEQSSAEENT